MTSICPECNSPLPESAPLGMCPACLLRSARGHSFAGRHREAGAKEPPPCEELAEIFAGKFDIEELVGRGGMGAVYRARQCRIDRSVAIKLLPFDDDDPASLERFLREAKALGKLNHPNIVTLIDFGEIGGYFYIVMEFVGGGDLGRKLNERALPETEVARITGQICDALEYAHSRGVVHRDIKPGNILLGEDTIKLVDFGLAKGMLTGDTDLNLTWANEMMGTPNYIAPEQRANPLEADHRADIYALGVLTYEMLTGKLPTGNFPPPSKAAKVSRAWDGIALKAMSTEPDQRFSDAATMAKSVRAYTKKKFPILPLFACTTIIVLLTILIGSFPKKTSPLGKNSNHTGGRVVAFGPNLFGQVTKLGSLERDDIVAVAANDEFLPDRCFALALTTGGEVVGLGDAPPPPPDLKDVSSIAVGLAHCLALTEDGQVVTWGYDQFPPPKLPAIQQIAAAGQLSAALSTDGKIFVWGVTSKGNTVEFESAVNKDIAKITAAPSAIIAQTIDGKIIIRGDAEGPVLKYREPNQAVSAISAGQEFGMALLQNGQLWGWGWDSIGEIPDDGNLGFDKLVCGPETSAIRRRNGNWQAWGKIGTHFPEQARNALDVDFGHHVGLAVIPSDQTIKAPPPRPQSLKKLTVLGPHRSEVKSLAFTPDQNLLFAASDHAIHAYDLNRNTPSIKTYHAPPEQPVTALAWDSKNEHLIAGFVGGKIRLFPGAKFPKGNQELGTESTAAISALAQNDETIFVGNSEGFINTMTSPDYALGNPKQIHEAPITAVAFAGERVFTYGWDSNLKISPYIEGQAREASTILESPAFGHDLAVSPDGQSLLASDWRGTLYRLDLQTMNVSRSWRGHRTNWDAPSNWLGSEASARIKLAWSPDGTLFASVGGDRIVRIWDAQRDQLIARTPGQLPTSTHVVTFLNNRQIVTAGEAAHALAIWEIPARPE